mmetsp:Transcript_14989/g.38493  ORF Transcript_14989/g.38493 Transcript_14989/m.38493 type:complete len:224 (+) Transcript_14989:219-890(+)
MQGHGSEESRASRQGYISSFVRRWQAVGAGRLARAPGTSSSSPSVRWRYSGSTPPTRSSTETPSLKRRSTKTVKDCWSFSAGWHRTPSTEASRAGFHLLLESMALYLRGRTPQRVGSGRCHPRRTAHLTTSWLKVPSRKARQRQLRHRWRNARPCWLNRDELRPSSWTSCAYDSRQFHSASFHLGHLGKTFRAGVLIARPLYSTCLTSLKKTINSWESFSTLS